MAKEIDNRERLIFAMDVPDCNQAKQLVDTLGDSVVFFKLGLELMMTDGYFDLMDWMLKRNKKIFADLKFFDIPATVGAAVRSLKNRGASFVTVHGNQAIMESAAENKGDSLNPEYRSRLVAKEIKKDKREDLFAATPPLEAKKLLFSMALTEGIGYCKNNRINGMKLNFIDVKRAYFHAKCKRNVYVRLPEEDKEDGMCAKLNMSMYGTRDAAQNWEEAYTEFMESIGFIRGRASPCIFYHKDRNMRAVIHGDDFTLLGLSDNLDWFRDRITERFEVKFKARLGPERGDDKSVRILNLSLIHI